MSETIDTEIEEDASSIMEYSEDISEAEAPIPLPEREYIATIKKTEQKVSGKGNKYIQVSFYVSPEEFPIDFDESNAPDGVILSYNRITLSDDIRGRYRMNQFCKSIGAPMGIQINFNDWIGLEARVKVTHQDYEGEKQASIEKVTLL